MKKIIIIPLLMVLFIPFSQGQLKIRPKVKAALDSMYPHASNIELRAIGKSQEICIKCNCNETVGMIILLFDTTGHFLNKEVHYYGTLNGLPDTILNYIKKNESTNTKFDKRNMIKYCNNNGEISYGIYMDYAPNGWAIDRYILKFKNTGEFISKEKIPEAKW
jgi:hypothetical protein